MSLLTVMESTPNRVRSLLRLTAALGESTTRDALHSYMMPARVGGDATQFNNLFRETLRLGLLTQNDSEIRLSDGLTAREVNEDAGFITFVTQTLLRPNTHSNENSAFPYALAWLLGQPSGTAIGWASDQHLTLQRQLEGSETYELTNEGRFAMLCYWARFLGFATQADLDGDKAVVPDPTEALVRFLPAVFGTEKRLSVSHFLTRLATLCTVLEGGQARETVEARQRLRRPPSELSPATSLALWRLEKRRRVRLDMSSDADAWQMMTSTAAVGVAAARRISHIEYQG